MRNITTKNGDPMAFVKFEDYTGAAELVIFPRTFKEHPGYWVADQVLFVQGKVNDRGGTKSILVDAAKPLADAIVRHAKAAARDATSSDPTDAAAAPTPAPAKVKELHILLDSGIDRAALESVKHSLAAIPGDTPVYCTITGENSRRVPTNITVSISDDLLQQLAKQIGSQRILVVG